MFLQINVVRPVMRYKCLSHFVYFPPSDEHLTWSKIFQSHNESKLSITMIEVFLMFLVDIVLFSMITWYFDRVKPGPFGIARPWNFLCKVSKRNKQCGISCVHLFLEVKKIYIIGRSLSKRKKAAILVVNNSFISSITKLTNLSVLFPAVLALTVTKPFICSSIHPLLLAKSLTKIHFYCMMTLKSPKSPN